jgi:hypothetical protein
MVLERPMTVEGRRPDASFLEKRFFEAKSLNPAFLDAAKRIIRARGRSNLRAAAVSQGGGERALLKFYERLSTLARPY